MRSKRELGATLPWMLAALVAVVTGAASAAAQTIQQGDVFASNGSGNAAWYRNDGTPVGNVNDGTGGFTTGGAFFSDVLYITNFSNGTVARYDSFGALLGNFSTGGSAPESIVFAANGEFYVGHADGDGDIRKFNSSLNLIDQYDVATTARGSDWIELAADQCTMFYTSEGSEVKRYDVCTDTQLADFASGFPGSNAYALRIRPNGEVLVADSATILRLDSAGNIIQQYDATGENTWFALNLDPDGTSFWSGDFTTQNFYKFDIATGNVLLGPINPGGSLFGLTVAGEITGAQPTPTPTQGTGPTPTVTPIATVTPIPPSPTPPTPVPTTNRIGLLFFIGLLGVTGAVLIWRLTMRG